MSKVSVLESRALAARRPDGLLERLGRAWCRILHSDISWPVNGYYRCRTCDRQYPVPWETPPTPDAAAVEKLHPHRRPAIARAAA